MSLFNRQLEVFPQEKIYVHTDSRGEALFEFYTADDSTSYTVIIEGLADDGSVIHKEGKLLIEKR